jgi:hypothetical protein
VFDSRVAAEGVDLIAGEFGLRAFASDDDGAASGIDFEGVTEGPGGGDEEKFSEHFNDVGVRVVIVVEEDDVEMRVEGGSVVRLI